MIGINSLTTFAVFFILLRRGAVSQVASLFFLMPPVTAAIDYLVLGDALTPYKVAGLALAASGVYLATRPQRAVGVRAAVRVRRAGGAMPAAISAVTATMPTVMPAAVRAGAALPVAPGGRRNLSAPLPAAPRSCPAPCE